MQVAQVPAPTGVVSEVLLETIRMKDDGGGVDYDTLVHAAVMAGHSREDAEDAIDNLRVIEGSIIEPRFSFFRLKPELSTQSSDYLLSLGHLCSNSRDSIRISTRGFRCTDRSGSSFLESDISRALCLSNPARDQQ